jgi:hypothetical protein
MFLDNPHGLQRTQVLGLIIYIHMEVKGNVKSYCCLHQYQHHSIFGLDIKCLMVIYGPEQRMRIYGK